MSFPNPTALAVAVGMILLVMVAPTQGVSGSSHASAPPASSLLSNATLPDHHLSTLALRGAVSASSPLQGNPGWLAYDSLTQSLYVAVPPSSVDIAPANMSWPNEPLVNQTIPVGDDPFGVAFDPVTGDVFVTNTGSNNVSVLYGNLSAPIASVPVGSEPMGIAYDSSNGYLYVSNNGSDNVSIINATTFQSEGSVAVGENPLGLAFNPYNDEIFVADSGSDSVDSISGMTDSVISTIGVGSDPYGVAVDNASGRILVTNPSSLNVSVIGSGGTSVIASVNFIAGPLEGLAYDWADGYVWVAAGINVAVIDPTSATVVYMATFDPSGMVFDPNNGNVCGTNTANRTLECIVWGEGGATTGPITVSESGLPNGSSWGFTIGPWVFYSNDSQAVVNPGWDQYGGFLPLSYYNALPAGFYFPGQAQLTSGSDQSASGVSFNYSVIPGEYPVAFWEQGLGLPDPYLSNWNVTLGGEQGSAGTSTVVFAEPNGTFPFTIPSYSSDLYGQPTTYYPSPCNGTVQVNGQGITTAVVFGENPTGCDTVQFSEAGLPTGETWNVSLDGTTLAAVVPSSELSFTEAPGTYAFVVGQVPGFTVTPSQGSINVGSAELFVNLAFMPVNPPYSITFNESGLPTGTQWSVSVAGEVRSTLADSLVDPESNGTFTYEVLPVPGYSPIPQSGSLVVDGNNVSQQILFVLNGSHLWPVNFQETGLPSGTSWSVVLNGTTGTSTTSEVQFVEPNGTYPFAIAPESGFACNDSGGNLTVLGGTRTVGLNFSTAPTRHFSLAFTESGLPQGTEWQIELGTLDQSTSNSTLTFSLPNGSYSYRISGPSDWTATPATGVTTVDGSSMAISVSFGEKASAGPSSASATDLWELVAALGLVAAIGGAITAIWVRGRRPPAIPPD